MDYLKDVLLGIWLLWCAPEFGWVREGLLWFFAGAAVGAFAMWEGRRAAKRDEREEEA